jgi:hypothetical protein
MLEKIRLPLILHYLQPQIRKLPYRNSEEEMSSLHFTRLTGARCAVTRWHCTTKC